MYIFLMIIHILVCLVLILVVLLQAGRGGGMSDMFGGGQPSSLFGTQTNVFLTRATEVCAVLFVVTSISLGWLTTRQSKSLMDTTVVPMSAAPMPVGSAKPLDAPAIPAQAASAPVPAPVLPSAPVQETASAAAQTAANAPAAGVPAEANAS